MSGTRRGRLDGGVTGDSPSNRVACIWLLWSSGSGFSAPSLVNWCRSQPGFLSSGPSRFGCLTWNPMCALAVPGLFRYTRCFTTWSTRLLIRCTAVLHPQGHRKQVRKLKPPRRAPQCWQLSFPVVQWTYSKRTDFTDVPLKEFF